VGDGTQEIILEQVEPLQFLHLGPGLLVQTGLAQGQGAQVDHLIGQLSLGFGKLLLLLQQQEPQPLLVVSKGASQEVYPAPASLRTPVDFPGQGMGVQQVPKLRVVKGGGIRLLWKRASPDPQEDPSALVKKI
jgi:hypothetical protein